MENTEEKIKAKRYSEKVQNLIGVPEGKKGESRQKSYLK